MIRVTIMLQINEGEINFSYSRNNIFNHEDDSTITAFPALMCSWNTEYSEQSFPTYESSLRK